MSLYNQTVSNTPLSLDGLINGDFSNIIIDGVPFDPKNVVPYTGATKSVNLNNKQLTNVSLIDANTIKINTVPAGTTSKYLATDSTGNVIEADITTKYVPYTGATSHVNLNAKNLSNVLTYSGTNVQVTSTETTSLLATGTTQVNTLRITSVPAGTQTNFLAVDSAGNVIVGTVPSTSQLNLTAAISSTVYYFPFIPSNSTGNQTAYVDTTAGTLTYLPSTKTLTVQNLAGNAATATKLYTTQTAVSSNYYFSFVPTNTAGNQDHYVAYPGTFGQDSYYTTGATLGDPGTFYFQRVNVAAAIQLPQDTTFPLISPGTAAFSLGIDSSNRIMKFTPGAPTVTATTANTGYYLAMCASNATGAQPLYVDGNGYITYNPSTYSLNVPNLTVSIGANIAAAVLTGIPTAPTAAPGTNTTQIATCQFVTTAIGSVSGYLPLTGGTMTGTISFASGTNNLLEMYYNKFVQYTNHISDTVGNNYISITTDAPNASPIPLAGFIVLNRNVSCSGQIVTSGNASFGGTTISTGKITGNNGLTITSGGVTYANIGIGGVNNIYADTQFYSSGGSNAVMQVSYGSGVNQNIDSSASYNWQTTSGSTGTTCLNLSTTQAAFRQGSMFDFATPGGWDNSNSLFVTTGGNGGNNNGVGIGYNTTLNSGLMVSIAPNVAWRRMSYKASDYYFYTNGNAITLVINSSYLTSFAQGYYFDATVGNPYVQFGSGVYVAKATTAGAFVNTAVAGDLVLNSRTGNVRIAGGSQYAFTPLVVDGAGITFGSSGVGLQTITGSPYGNVSTYGNNGWNGYDINRRWCLMGWQTNTEAGFHDNTYSWIWRTTANNFIVDRPSVIYTNVPQQTYYPNQVLVGNNGGNLEWGVMYSTYRYGGYTAWGGGTVVSSFYKASSISNIRISGAASYYVPGSGMYYTECQFQNLSTGISYYLYQYQFTNVAYNHVSYPICFQFGGLPVGSYNVYLRCNAITDGNDHVYILGEIVPF